MKISIIVAVANNLAIGKNNDLLWHLPKDMKFFKETTEGHCIITGRKNYESIPEKYRPLRNRTNIIVTRQSSSDLGYEPNSNLVVLDSIESAIEKARALGESEVFIIGGGEIYKQSLHLADSLYITNVDTIFEDAHTFFPSIELDQWELISKTEYASDEKHKFNFTINQYTRKA